MKKKKFNKKLSLNKESIANLNYSEMKKVNGGKHKLPIHVESIECYPETGFVACELTNFPMNTCFTC